MPAKIQVSGFTAEAKSLLREIITSVSISEPYSSQNPQLVKYAFKALWDTGATNCSITSDVVRQLKIQPINQIEVKHAGGTSMQNVYLIDLHLPNNVIFEGIHVTEMSNVVGHISMLIGMDIITQGDFAITNLNGKSKVSFSTPSLVSIDFRDFIQNSATIHSEKVGRNDPCPCGSGEKYKKCHGK